MYVGIKEVLKGHLQTEHNRCSLLPADIDPDSPVCLNSVVILERSVVIENAVKKGLRTLKVNQGRNGFGRWAIR